MLIFLFKKPLFFCLVFCVSIIYAQNTVYSYVKDNKGLSVERAEIYVKELNKRVLTDKIGYFQLVDIPKGDYEIQISKSGLETKTFSFNVTEAKRQEMSIVVLQQALSQLDAGYAVLDDQQDQKEDAVQSNVGLLQASRDVFAATSSFDLGVYWFRPRGIDNRSGETLMNGISMLSPDNGRVDFSDWGGLNDITRYPEISLNHAPSEYSFGGINSVVYKNTKASEYRKGNQLSYATTNRNYNHRLTYRFSSGMSKKKWAFTFMLARRWAEEGIQEGTLYDAYGSYLGIEKIMNSKHTIAFNAFASPSRRSSSSPNTQEVIDLRGVHYNSYWGEQDGQKRNERVRESFQPILQLTDYWKINQKTKLWTSLSFQFGENSASRLDWQNANNPSPTYYRNLPSYSFSTGNITSFNQQTSLWQTNDLATTQLDWGRLYRVNLISNSGTYYGQTGKKAIYYLAEDVANQKIGALNSHFSHQWSDQIKIMINFSAQYFDSNYFRRVKDQLGSDFVLNRDPFAFARNQSGLFNLNDTKVGKMTGDKIGYDYNLSGQKYSINPGVKFEYNRLDFFISSLISYVSSQRRGGFQHYLFANSSGKSDVQKFINLGLKAQVNYKLDGRNYISYNGAIYNEAPVIEESFINARYTNDLTPNLKNKTVLANDFSYLHTSPFLKLRATFFMINTKNDVSFNRYFADGIGLNTTDESGSITKIQSAFVTQVMTNVERQNRGIELGAEIKITPTFNLTAVASKGQYIFNNNPQLYFVSDVVGNYSDGKTYQDFGKAYLKGYKQGGTPQEAYSLGFRYNSTQFWWVGLNANYVGANYLEPSAVLRTENFVQNSNSQVPYDQLTEDELRRVLKQEKFEGQFFINANAGKSWLIGKYYTMLSASVTNILNNKTFVTSGFEQTREVNYRDFSLDRDSDNRVFGPKLWMIQGLSYYINLQFRF